jgi:hypothetical protein
MCLSPARHRFRTGGFSHFFCSFKLSPSADAPQWSMCHVHYTWSMLVFKDLSDTCVFLCIGLDLACELCVCVRACGV